jgi:hypothetical protein
VSASFNGNHTLFSEVLWRPMGLVETAVICGDAMR